MSGAERLVRDFVVAARLLAAGDPESAMWCLLPAQVPLEHRLPAMVVVGSLITGAMTGARDPRTPAAGPLAGQLVAAGAAADSRSIRDLIAVHRGEILVDALVELVGEFAAQDEVCCWSLPGWRA